MKITKNKYFLFKRVNSIMKKKKKSQKNISLKEYNKKDKKNKKKTKIDLHTRAIFSNMVVLCHCITSRTNHTHITKCITMLILHLVIDLSETKFHRPNDIGITLCFTPNIMFYIVTKGFYLLMYWQS